MNQTIDAATIQNAGTFLFSELDRLDKTLNLPLGEYTWPRDIDQRRDIELSDETISHLRANYFAVGQGNSQGKSWFSDKATVIPEVSIGTEKKSKPVYLWAEGMSHSIFELDRAARLGRNLDDQKAQAINAKWNQDANEMVYLGDKGKGEAGLCNNPDVKITPIAQTWPDLKAADLDSAPDKILAQINAILDASWLQSNRTVVGSRILLPPSKYALLVGTRMRDGNNKSVLTYIKEECLSTHMNGNVEILPCTALAGTGAGNKDRMVVYTKNPRYLRFPLTSMRRTAPRERDLHFATVFYCAMAGIEFIYPETVLYADGI